MKILSACVASFTVFMELFAVCVASFTGFVKILSACVASFTEFVKYCLLVLPVSLDCLLVLLVALAIKCYSIFPAYVAFILLLSLVSK